MYGSLITCVYIYRAVGLVYLLKRVLLVGLCDMDKKNKTKQNNHDFFNQFCDFAFNPDFETCLTFINAFCENLKLSKETN